jgi:hypothetical protein
MLDGISSVFPLLLAMFYLLFSLYNLCGKFHIFPTLALTIYQKNCDIISWVNKIESHVSNAPFIFANGHYINQCCID